MKIVKRMSLCLIMLLLLSSFGAAAPAETVSSEPFSLSIAVDLRDTGLSDSLNAGDPSSLEAMEFGAWLDETFPDTEKHVTWLRYQDGLPNEKKRLASKVRPVGEYPDGENIDVFIVSYDPAYVTPSFDGNVSVSGMVMVGYNEDSAHPEEAKAVAEYFAERFGVLPFAAAAE